MKKKCSVKNCKNKVVGAYTVDLDIDGLPFCKEHKGDVGSAMLWAILGIPEMAQNTLGFNSKKKTPKMKASGKKKN